MDLDLGEDPILSWDSISSRNLRLLYADGRVSL